MKNVLFIVFVLLLASCVRVTPAPRIVPPPAPPVVNPVKVINDTTKALPKPDPAAAASEVVKKAPKVNANKILKSLEKLPALPMPGDLLK